MLCSQYIVYVIHNDESKEGYLYYPENKGKWGLSKNIKDAYLFSSSRSFENMIASYQKAMSWEHNEARFRIDVFYS